MTTGVGCTAPPISAKFYPFWSLSPLFGGLGGHSAGCVWNFGNDQPNTVLDFGKDAQYGAPNLARYGGTLISAPRRTRSSPAAAGLGGNGQQSSASGVPRRPGGAPRSVPA